MAAVTLPENVSLVLDSVWEATGALSVCISERLDVVKAATTRKRLREAAMIADLKQSVGTLTEQVCRSWLCKTVSTGCWQICGCFNGYRPPPAFVL